MKTITLNVNGQNVVIPDVVLQEDSNGDYVCLQTGYSVFYSNTLGFGPRDSGNYCIGNDVYLGSLEEAEQVLKDHNIKDRKNKLRSALAKLDKVAI